LFLSLLYPPHEEDFSCLGPRTPSIDQQPRRRASSPSAILIIGRCVAAVMMATIVLTIGPFLRATGA
jgi:hypothetical protein